MKRAAQDHPLLPMFAEIVAVGGGEFRVRPSKPIANMTVKEAAAFLAVSDSTIYVFCRVGLLPHERPTPRSMRIPVEAVRALKQKTEDPEYWDTPEGQRFKAAAESARGRQRQRAAAPLPATGVAEKGKR